ncbi:MAG: Asp-tRNA(Asn)/Glu-tRNA(Gln) amidotransferase subunit GatB [Actinomycetota bacterium]
MSLTTDLATTVGLEIHVELSTNTKMFCGCPVAFGGEPNTRVCPVCLGHPGTLPVPNEVAVEYATKIALALGCEIAPYSIFHRKNYFYPDMPKNYQISQYDIPIGSRGGLEIESGGKTQIVRITRVHLEEDTGKSLHIGGGGRIDESTHSLEDFNRAGTPLVEIVTEPDLTSPESARIFATELRSILEYLEVSDVRMEQGSMRVDANISVARSGERGVKAEVKNMNSLRSIERALAYEQERQGHLVAKGLTMASSTRHWDENSGQTKPLRTKEEAFDYRYFPEPDLTPIAPSIDWIAGLQDQIPELPSQRRLRLESDLGLSPYDSSVLTSSKAIGDFYEQACKAAQKAEPKQVANLLTNEVVAALTERNEELEDSKLTPEALGELADLAAEGAVSKNQSKEILAEILKAGGSPGQVMQSKGIRQVSDTGTLEAAVDEAIAANPDVAERIKAGEDKPFGFMVGQVMKATKGQGNPKIINDLLKKRLR